MKDIGQKEIAARLLITQQAYSKIEKSEEIPLPRLRVILTALGSSLEELLELTRLLTEKK
jgi:transcriptional regulator with XRE-family HTH domain